MKIRDIMKRDVMSVKPDDNAMDVVGLLLRKKISGLPVVDAKGQLAGMFTEKEVLSYILPSYLEKVGKFIYEEDPKITGKKFMELSGMKVSQLMRKEVVTASEDASLCNVAKDMLTRKARRVPVVDAKGYVIGIVARSDVLEAFLKQAGIEK